MKSTSETINAMNEGTDIGAPILASILSFFSLDQSGSTLQTSQRLKLIKRVKYIGLYYGDQLELFLAKMTKGSDVDEEERIEIMEYIEEHGNGFWRKFYLYAVSLRIRNGMFWSLVAYWTANLIHCFAYLALKSVVKKGKVSKIMVYFLHFERKVHFIVFQSTLMDLLFFGIRIIAHRRMTKKSITIKVILSITLLSQFCFLYQLFRVSLTSNFKNKISRKQKINQIADESVAQ